MADSKRDVIEENRDSGDGRRVMRNRWLVRFVLGSIGRGSVPPGVCVALAPFRRVLKGSNLAAVGDSNFEIPNMRRSWFRLASQGPARDVSGDYRDLTRMRVRLLDWRTQADLSFPIRLHSVAHLPRKLVSSILAFYVTREHAHSAGVLVSALLEDCWEPITCPPGRSVAQTPPESDGTSGVPGALSLNQNTVLLPRVYSTGTRQHGGFSVLEGG